MTIRTLSPAPASRTAPRFTLTPELRTAITLTGLTLQGLLVGLLGQYGLDNPAVLWGGYLVAYLAGGIPAGREALRSLIRPDTLAKGIAAKLSEPHDLVLLTGVGAAFPLVRSHTVLNNLHAVVDRVPLVMFFPGSYSGHDLRLFGLLKDDNYYRAFPLVPRPTFSIS